MYHDSSTTAGELPQTVTGSHRRRASLVNIAKFQAAFKSLNNLRLAEGGVIDPETGEFTVTDVNLRLQRNPLEIRLERFALQSVSRDILHGWRIRHCLRTRARGANVAVLASADRSRVRYAGLQTCGSVWVCPVCAAKIAERRRAELVQGVSTWLERGGSVWMLTLTHPHTREDTLSDLVAAEQRAKAYFWGHRTVKTAFRSVGLVGHVRAWEVTHGRRGTGNGWHPHFHILVFVGASDLEARARVHRQVLPVWQAACIRSGLGVPDLKRCPLQDAEQAASYAAKWGAESEYRGWRCEDELTKGHVKRARLGGETPFDLLRAALGDRSDGQARALFFEFATIYARPQRGGSKKQLVWSRGLRALLGLGQELTDEEIAALQEDDLSCLGRLTVDEWRLILRHDLRGEVLELARSGGWDAVTRLLSSFTPSP